MPNFTSSWFFDTPAGAHFWPIYAAGRAAERAGRVPRHGAWVSVGNTRLHPSTPCLHMVSHPVRADGEHYLRDREWGAGSVPPPAVRRFWRPPWAGYRTGWTASTRSGIAAPPRRPRSELLPSEYVKANRCYFTCEGRGERAAAVPRAVRRSLRNVRLGLSALGHRLAGYVAGDRRARGPYGRHARAHPGGQRARVLPPRLRDRGEQG